MSMTRTGAVMGTPYYMSPEQARGSKIDHRSDLYSVGVVMYQSVTGRVPFNAETFNELVFKIALESPEPAELLTPELDPAFSAIIHKAMARDLAQRFQTAREFQAAIAQWMMTGTAAIGAPTAVQTGGYPSQHGYPSQPGQPSYASNPLFAQSAATGGPLAQGNYQGGGPLGQSSPQHQQHLAQSGGLGASQAGMALTGPQKKSSNGAVIAIVLSSIFVVICGGGFAAYKMMAHPAVGTGVATTPSAEPTTPTAPPVATTAAPVASNAPSTEPSAPPSTEPSTTPSVAAQPTGRLQGHLPTGGKKPPVGPTPTAPATTPPKTGGRTVEGTL
jgi:serine/threonine-protein kinase